MAYTLDAEIHIDHCSFRYAQNIVIQSSWRELGDTCTMSLPNLRGLLEKKIQTGMPVTVKLGYNQMLHTEFTGYVTDLQPSIPFEIRCEDELYHLKRTSVNGGKGQAWRYKSLRRVLNDLLKPLKYHLSNRMPDVRFDQFRIESGTTLAQALQKLKENFLLCAYFRNGELFVGLPYTEISTHKTEDGTLAIYDLQRNVIENRLVFKRKEDIRLKVKAIGLLKDNQQVSVEVGDSDGEERTFHYHGEKEVKQLKKLATAELERLKYDGYRGSFLAFGLPRVVHSGIVELRDVRYPERQGRYMVEAVKTSWGTNGFRREVSPGPKVVDSHE